VRYGSRTSLVRVGDLVTRTEETFANYATVKRQDIYTEIKHVHDDRDILTEFLKLMDKFKDGAIDMPGLQVIRDPRTDRLRIEKTWIVKV
jgi:hypothetical protein